MSFDDEKCFMMLETISLHAGQTAPVPICDYFVPFVALWFASATKAILPG